MTHKRNTLSCPLLGSGLACGDSDLQVCEDCPDNRMESSGALERALKDPLPPTDQLTDEFWESRYPKKVEVQSKGGPIIMRED